MTMTFICPLLILLHFTFASVRGFIEGVPQACTTEGQLVRLADVSAIPDSPCLSCRCQAGFVQCTREVCEDLTHCPRLQPAPSNGTGCCDSCAKCWYAGRYYANGDHWRSTQFSCRTFTCKGGVVTVGRMACAEPSCAHPVRRPGHCCPLCPPEPRRRDVALLQRALPSCVRCPCVGRLCQCYRTVCPALPCPPEAQARPPGACCPECAAPEPAPTELERGECRFQNETYASEQSFRPDPCSKCLCQDGRVLCRRFLCPALACPRSAQFYSPSLCCPRCRNEPPPACMHQGKEYAEGSSFPAGPCTRCKCRGGAVSCARTACPFGGACPRGYRAKAVQGQCCPACEEKEGVCSVSRGSRFRSFDDARFAFGGSCRYALVRNCSRTGLPGSFTVVGHNGRRWRKLKEGQTVGLAKLRHVTVRLATETRKFRISLLRNQRVKVNGRLVSRLPAFELGAYNILRSESATVVRAFGALKVVWGSDGSLKLSVSSKLKGLVCGLCGNYNGDSADDGGPELESWRFGSLAKCRDEADRDFHRAQKAARREDKSRRRKVDGRLSWSFLSASGLGKKPMGTRYELAPKARLWSPPELLPEAVVPRTAASSLFSSSSLPSSLSSSSSSSFAKELCGGSAKWRTSRKARQHCHVLMSPEFAACRLALPVAAYHKWCVLDACGCPSAGRCYCESLSAFAAACGRLGLPRPEAWRDAAACARPDCPEGAAFVACAACQTRCGEEASPCPSSCVPGCQCPNGMSVHGGRCVATCPAL